MIMTSVLGGANDLIRSCRLKSGHESRTSNILGGQGGAKIHSLKKRIAESVFIICDRLAVNTRVGSENTDLIFGSAPVGSES